MSMPRRVAWLDWAEWHDVKGKLFSDSLAQRREALLRVNAWRDRGNNLPLAVDATAQLVELARLHSQIIHDSCVAQRSHNELQSMYSIAILRAVNGLVDPSQRGTYAAPVSVLAEQIGLPVWLVDVRHQATHNQMPSLDALQFAASTLLDWLKEHYWDQQAQHLTDIYNGIHGALQASSLTS
jgi:hypothetical protein